MKKKSIADKYDSMFGLSYKMPDLSDYFVDEFGVFGSNYRKAKPFKNTRKKPTNNRAMQLFAGYNPTNDKEALEQDKYANRTHDLTGYDGYNTVGKIRQQ